MIDSGELKPREQISAMKTAHQIAKGVVWHLQAGVSGHPWQIG